MTVDDGTLDDTANRPAADPGSATGGTNMPGSGSGFSGRSRAGGTQERGSAGRRQAPAAQGLVICAKTGRDDDQGEDDWSPGELWSPAFPSADLVSLAADLLPRAPRWDGIEGPRWHVTVGPGCVAIGSTDRAKQERTAQRESEAARIDADVLAAWLLERGEFPEDPDPSREITGWSRKSRANMVRSLCELDYAPLFGDPTRLLAMVTLTYPGDWLTVAPNGKAVKDHLRRFRKRYRRAWEEDFACVWKLEFQRRGAPHVHMLCRPPHGHTKGRTFREWLSWAWADVVAHPDPVQRMKHEAAGTAIDWNEGLRSTDPRRVAVYFTKHGAFAAKEYQHCVPEAWQEPGQGPGRFWGYWGLAKATRGVEVSPQTAVEAARIVRRWARAQGTTRQVLAPRVNHETGQVRYRKQRRRVDRLRSGRGWVSVNDGPAFASQLARWLNEDRVVAEYGTPMAQAAQIDRETPGTLRMHHRRSDGVSPVSPQVSDPRSHVQVQRLERPGQGVD